MEKNGNCIVQYTTYTQSYRTAFMVKWLFMLSLNLYKLGRLQLFGIASAIHRLPMPDQSEFIPGR
jgi:hypothetical protein